MEIEIRSYSPDYFDAWNNFVATADNSNFLFHRNFMEYHKDRFEDSSALIFDGGQLVGIFPANKKDNTVYSHQGLTYGGLILNERRNEKKLLSYFYALIKYFHDKQVAEMVYKPVPNYISKTTNDFEHFVLNMLQAELIKVDTSFVLDNKQELKFQERRRRSIKKGAKQNTEVRYNNNFDEYWNDILVPNLSEKFGTKPVHSLEEIKLLHNYFPEKITQVNGYVDNKIVAGVTLFNFDNCIHCQYISSNDFGRDCGAIDFLFDNIIQTNQKNAVYFSLGTANNNGKDLNLGLCDWKEGWGAKIWAHFHYKFKVENFKNLERFIL